MSKAVEKVFELSFPCPKITTFVSNTQCFKMAANSLLIHFLEKRETNFAEIKVMESVSILLL